MTRTHADGAPPVRRIEFDGTPVAFTPGQTIGGALAGAGIVSWRTTRRDHAPRGLFCGIGVCFDCLVTVDGVRSQRACLVEACEGQDVRSSDPEEALPVPGHPGSELPVPAHPASEHPASEHPVSDPAEEEPHA